jgi:hypothetical protein
MHVDAQLSGFSQRTAEARLRMELRHQQAAGEEIAALAGNPGLRSGSAGRISHLHAEIASSEALVDVLRARLVTP